MRGPSSNNPPAMCAYVAGDDAVGEQCEHAAALYITVDDGAEEIDDLVDVGG